MHLAVIVTEYPKTTETFILRDILKFVEFGADVRLYHLAPYNRREILHDFAAPTQSLARHVGLAGPAVISAAAGKAGLLAAPAAAILKRQSADPVLVAKSLLVAAAAAAIARELTAWGADHVHAEFAGHPATAAWTIHRLTGLPYSVSCRAHDIFRTQRLLSEKLGQAAFVRTVSNYGRKFLIDRVPGLDPGRMHVIHSSVDTDAIPKLPAPSGDGFDILYVGSLQERKGVNILLDALAGLTGVDWRCRIAGDGPDRGQLERQARALGLTGRVSFLGPQDFDTIRRLYAQANVVAVPSVIGPAGRTEGIPNVAIEGLAHQRPVISTNVSGIPELIRERETGWLVEPGSAEALRAAIADIAAHPETAHEIARRGRQLVEREFALSVNARRQVDLFRAHSRGEMLGAAQ